MDSRTPVEVLALIRAEIEALESPRFRSAVLQGLITQIRESRMFPTGNEDESSKETQGDLWLFFIIPKRLAQKVALAYSEEGYSAWGLRWGLVSVDENGYGCSGGWYDSLSGMLLDSGYFEGD